jgi:hypothetical protein
MSKLSRRPGREEIKAQRHKKNSWKNSCATHNEAKG